MFGAHCDQDGIRPFLGLGHFVYGIDTPVAGMGGEAEKEIFLPVRNSGCVCREELNIPHPDNTHGFHDKVCRHPGKTGSEQIDTGTGHKPVGNLVNDVIRQGAGHQEQLVRIDLRPAFSILPGRVFKQIPAELILELIESAESEFLRKPGQGRLGKITPFNNLING